MIRKHSPEEIAELVLLEEDGDDVEESVTRESMTTSRTVTAKDGRVYTIPEWAPRRVRLDKHGRPELFMNPEIFTGAAKPSSVKPPKSKPKPNSESVESVEGSSESGD